MKVSIQDGPAKVTLKLMWPRTGSVVVEVVEAVGVVKVQGVVGQVPVEVAEEMVEEAEVKIVVIKVRGQDRAVEAELRVPTQGTPDTRWPGMLTCPHLRPASVTGNSESQLIFVWSQVPVPGRTTGSRRPTIDSLTSSRTSLTMNFYILLYIKIKFKKYKLMV